MTRWGAQVRRYQLQHQWTDRGAETAFPLLPCLSSWLGRCQPRAAKAGKVLDVVCLFLWLHLPPPSQPSQFSHGLCSHLIPQVRR